LSGYLANCLTKKANQVVEMNHLLRKLVSTALVPAGGIAQVVSVFNTRTNLCAEVVEEQEESAATYADEESFE
jgi:hypothetical protein